MESNPTAGSRLVPKISSAATWAAGLLIAGLIGGLWFAQADDSAREAVPLAGVLVLTAAAGITWLRSRARARRRWQVALDAYAEREMSWERRSVALKRVRMLSSALGHSSNIGNPLKRRTQPAPRH